MATKASQLALMAQYTATDGKVNSDLIDNLDSSQFLRDDVDETMAGNLQFTGTGYVLMPSGTTAQRPVSATPGMIRYNSTLGVLEQYISDNVWVSIAPSASITGVTLPGSQTAVSSGDTITINGISFDTNATISFIDTGSNETAASVSTRISSTRMTAIIPSLSEGTYDVKVTNGNGTSATFESAFDVDGVAIFNTASGSLGTLLDNVDSANFDCGAVEDGSAVSCGVTSGSLPNGLSMDSTGNITGTPNTGVSSPTTYTFTVTATDSENQTSTRSFSITIEDNYQQSGSIIFQGE
jgi:hypothetical protein